MINCCHYCRHKNKCHNDTYGEPLCRPGQDCSYDIVWVNGAKTRLGCNNCPDFRPSREAWRRQYDRYVNHVIIQKK